MSDIPYKYEILERLLKGESLSSNDFYWSNSNQYFCKLKKDDHIDLIEEWAPNLNGRGRHKVRSLAGHRENIENARALLKSYKRHSTLKNSDIQGKIRNLSQNFQA